MEKIRESVMNGNNAANRVMTYWIEQWDTIDETAKATMIQEFNRQLSFLLREEGIQTKIDL